MPRARHYTPRTATTPSPRGPNLVIADYESLTSADGQRRITLRTVKRLLPGNRFEPVRIAQLKEQRDGKWHVILNGMSEDAARKFLEGNA